MNKLISGLAASIISIASQASAAVVTYEYTGQPLDTVTVNGDVQSNPEDFSFFGEVFTLIFSLDDVILGRSYKNLDLRIQSCTYSPCTSQDPEEAIVSWVAGGPAEYLPSIPETFIETDINFRTDASGNVISGRVNWLSGPPDGGF